MPGWGGVEADGLEHCSSRSYRTGGDPDVSVVIATFERAELWPELIAALERQSFGVTRFEVVVVDDHSADGTWDMLHKEAARTDLRLVAVRLSSNVGSGAARSVGLGLCRGPVVAFTDDDCLPEPTWLECLSAPLVVGVAGSPPATVVQGRTLPVERWPADAGPWARTLWVDRPTWLFETCNIAYRTADLRAAGGFPSRAETPPVRSGRQVGEDALAGWRVVEEGAELVFRPDALVRHQVVPSSYWEWLEDLRGRSVFPALAARHPLARRALWSRWFLSPRSAATVLAVLAGVGSLATRRPAWALGVVPWMVAALPDARHRPGRPVPVRLCQLALGDLVALSATTRASVRHRRLVL